MSAPAGICVYRGPELRIDFINPACEEFCGNKMLLGKTFDEAFPELLDSETRHHHFRVFETGETFKDQAVAVTRDFGEGRVETRYFDMVLQPSIGPDGEIQGLDTYAFDVSAMVNAQSRENVLAEANRTLMSSLDYGQTLKYVVQTATETFADTCAIFLVDRVQDPKNPRGTLLRARAVEFDARTIEQRKALDSLLSTYVALEDGPTPVSRVLRTGEQVVAHPVQEGLISSLGGLDDAWQLRGLIPEAAIAAPMKLSGQLYGVILYGSMSKDRVFSQEDLNFAQKLTDTSTLAVSNAQLFGQLKASLKARDELLSICSHELRTPLTSLKLHTDMTKKIFATDGAAAFSQERMRKFVELSDRQLDRLTRLIEEMLDFSRISGGRLQLNRAPVNLAELLEEQVERLTPQAMAANCPLLISQAEPVTGHWDRFRLEQVFANLIGNAIKYGAGRPISIRLSQTPDYAVVHVLDEGIGILKEDQSRIFQPYERAVSPGGISGLGLGLYISEQVVSAHGGKIQVESAPGRGSDFVVELPKNTEAPVLH